MYRITAVVLLVLAASAARAEQLEPQRCGVIVWEPYPHCHDGQPELLEMQKQVLRIMSEIAAAGDIAKNCAPGYEANCQARDHGTDGLRRVNPVTGK